MKTYDDEATQYNNPSQNHDDEATALPDSGAANMKQKNGREWKQYAASAGSGILIGAIAPMLMGMKSADKPEADKPDDVNPGNGREELSHPEWVDNEVAVATSVNDDMSFGQAFASARNEVGSGGVFEWRGNMYTTHTAEEWAAMTPEEKAEYSDHFSWNHIDHSSSNVAQHSQDTHGQQSKPDDTAQLQEDADDDIEVVSVDTPGKHDVAQNIQVDPATDDDIEVVAQDPEIEIIGVVHDADANVNVAGMNIDGQDVILIDVDNDMTFDFLAADVNGNGQLDDNELVDIQSQNLTVNGLGGFSDPVVGDLYADNGGPDYLADGVYEG